MEVDATPAAPKQANGPVADPLPESEVYLRLLIIYLLLANSDTHPQTLKLAHETVDKIQSWNRRSMDTLAARVWFALGRVYELSGELADIRPYAFVP